MIETALGGPRWMWLTLLCLFVASSAMCWAAHRAGEHGWWRPPWRHLALAHAAGLLLTVALVRGALALLGM